MSFQQTKAWKFSKILTYINFNILVYVFTLITLTLIDYIDVEYELMNMWIEYTKDLEY